MRSLVGKASALAEVLLFRALIFTLGFVWYRSAAGQWQIRTLGHWYGSHALFIAGTVLLLWMTRRSFAAYGLTLAHWREDVRAAMGAYFPSAIGMAVLGFVDHRAWTGALIIVVVQIVVLVWITRALRGKPDVSSGLWTIGLSVLLFGGYGLWKALTPAPVLALANAAYYLLFIGLGEEVMNRGYTLTRLNEAFGKPYRFADVSWGWGTLLAAVLFGASHVLNGYNPITGVFRPEWAWGLWTTVGALVFTYVREKTGSLVAPAILHGLPQATIYALLRLR